MNTIWLEWLVTDNKHLCFQIPDCNDCQLAEHNYTWHKASQIWHLTSSTIFLGVKWRPSTNRYGGLSVGWSVNNFEMVSSEKVWNLQYQALYVIRCHYVASDDNRWHQMTSNDIRWHQIAINDIRCHHMSSDVIIWQYSHTRWQQMTTDDHRWQ